jgi:hypothetical protein
LIGRAGTLAAYCHPVKFISEFFQMSSTSRRKIQRLANELERCQPVSEPSIYFRIFSDEFNFLKEDTEIDQMTRLLPDFWAKCLFLNFLDKFNFLDSEIDRDELEHCQPIASLRNLF